MSKTSYVSKTEYIRDQLCNEIVRGRYAPGEPIPERSVAEELDVSRIPVREALIQLERDGLVAIRPGRGAYVQVFTTDSMQSLYETREALEGMAARLAAERMDPAEVTELRNRYNEALADSDRADEAQITLLGNDLHSKITDASRNSVIIEMSRSIANRVEICRRLSNRQVPRSLMLQGAQEHLRIIEALEAEDPDLAERTMREHIATWAGLLRQRLVGDFRAAPIRTTTRGRR